MKSVFLILGNQLFPHKHLRKYKDSTIFMCESFDLCTFQKHHKLKLILFLSSMRSYADELKKNKFKVNYIDLKKNCNHISISFIIFHILVSPLQPRN